MAKRKRGDDSEPRPKRIKVTSAPDPSVVGQDEPQKDPVHVEGHHEPDITENPSLEVPIPTEKPTVSLTRRKEKINKLQPPRPFPTVPTSVSATGPRSAHHEGKNLICVTRKTPLGAYMRRCKDAVIKDGYKTLHLSAMGAAIPHLIQLVAALPPILPFHAYEITTQLLTGTVEVQDEIMPEDDDDDVTYRIRGKSSLTVVLKIGDGQREGEAGQKQGRKELISNQPALPTRDKTRKAKTPPQQVVFQEPEQDDMEY